MGTIASQITSLTIVYSIVYSGADQRKHQSSASLTFVWGIHRGPVNSPHKWPVTRKMFPFDDVIMVYPNFMDADASICELITGEKFTNIAWFLTDNRTTNYFWVLMKGTQQCQDVNTGLWVEECHAGVWAPYSFWNIASLILLVQYNPKISTWLAYSKLWIINE